MSRFSTAGTWSLLTLAAVVVPVWIEVAAQHRGHWAGGDTDVFWTGFVVPWAARLEALVLLVALAGWATHAARRPDRQGRLVDGVLGAALGVGLCALAALPSWVWLARLGAAPTGVLVRAGGLALAPPLVAGLTAGAGGAWLPAPAAAALGALGGGALLWSMWGALG